MINKLDSKLFILIFGRFLQILISLVAIKLVTKYLDSGELGNFYLLVSIASFFGLFFVGPLGQYINRKTHQWYAANKILNIFYLYNYYILLLALLSLGIIQAFKYLGIGDSINIGMLSIVLFIYIISHSWNQTIIPMLNMLEHRISFVIFTVLSQLLFLISSYVFISYFQKTGILWFFGQAVGFGFIALLSFIYFIKKVQNDFNIRKANKEINLYNFKKIFKFSIPLFIGALFFWLQTQSYSLIVEKYIGAEFLGHLGVGFAVAFAISAAFESIIIQYIYPTMYKHMDNESKFSTVMSKIINLILPIYFLLAVFVSLFAIYINSILVDHKYFDSYVFIIFGIWISFFRMSANIIANIAHSKMKTYALVRPNFIGAILTVFGISLAIQTQNYTFYIPFIMSIASLIYFVLMYVSMNKISRIIFNFENYFFVMKYSVVFLVGIIFYDKATDMIYSLSLLTLFGIYFLFILYKLIDKGKGIE